MRWIIGALASCFGLLGCSGEDDHASAGDMAPYPYVSSVPAAGCDVPNACDIREGDCQSAWAATVSCLRLQPEPLAVSIRVLDEATFANEVAAAVVEPRPSPDHWERALTYLHFVQPGALEQDELVSAQVENLGAVYQPETQNIIVIDRGQRSDSIIQNSLLLHELVHAAQDRELGLEAFFDGFTQSSDSYAGLLGLIEGEAELFQTFALAGLNGISPDEVDLAAALEEKAERSLRTALEDASPYLKARYTVPYGLGASFVHGAYLAGGVEGIRDLYAAPPLSSRRLLIGDVAGDQVLAAPEFIDVASATSASLEHVDFDSFGALGLMFYGGPEHLATTRYQAGSLRGDRLDVFSASNATAIVWQLAFDTAASARAFYEVAKGRYYANNEQDWFDLGDGRLVFVASPWSSSMQDTIITALDLSTSW